jgi:hypothetical protein
MMDDNLPRTCSCVTDQLMSVVSAPAAALLVVTIEVASESLVASILAALVSLPSSLVACRSSKTTILTTGLGAVKPMALEMARISSVTGLLGLRRRKDCSRGRICGRSWSTGLG